MTQLSPEAQAVLNAVDTLYGKDISHGYLIIATALHVAAIRTLLTAEQHAGPTPNEYELGWNAAVDYLQNIANELEAL
jgi:hypothetical protein